MRIGLAITTTDRRTVHDSISMHDADELFIHIDKSMSGVSKSRNNCIKHLYDQGHDYIAIMDDDVQILKHGAFRYCAEVMSKNDLHMTGTPSSFHSKVNSAQGEIVYWDSIIGSFHMFSRRFIDEVGYFNTEYDRYGFEDTEMQWRAKQSNLCGKYTGIPCALRMPFYLLSEDVYHMNPEPNISKEDKDIYIKNNTPILHKAVESGQIYYPYK